MAEPFKPLTETNDQVSMESAMRSVAECVSYACLLPDFPAIGYHTSGAAVDWEVFGFEIARIQEGENIKRIVAGRQKRNSPYRLIGFTGSIEDPQEILSMVDLENPDQAAKAGYDLNGFFKSGSEMIAAFYASVYANMPLGSEE